MFILIVGADHLGNITKNLGCHSLTHIKGRKNINSRNLKIPERTDLVVVMTDYVGHNIACYIREMAKSQSVPVVFSKRSWAYLSQKLELNKKTA